MAPPRPPSLRPRLARPRALLLLPLPLLALLLLLGLASAAPPSNSTECRFRALTYAAALQRMPWKAPLRNVFDALELQAMCGYSPPKAPAPAAPPAFPLPHGAVFADAAGGSDANSGAEDSPVASGAHRGG